MPTRLRPGIRFRDSTLKNGDHQRRMTTIPPLSACWRGGIRVTNFKVLMLYAYQCSCRLVLQSTGVHGP